MSSLPPYSTYRTGSNQMMFPQASSHGNILTFTPPGFKHALNVKFPDSRLAVCEKCKKNFKTRDMCRVRNAHTGSPWTTAYICITLDESCTDENGKYVDKPLTVRMVQWQPYCVRKPFEPKTPVCAACKKTNRTRSFCRERHKHRQLPWCTVYVLLSALDRVDPQTVVAAPSKLVDNSQGDATGSADNTPTKTGEGNKLEDSDGKDDVALTGTPMASSFDSSSNTTVPTSDDTKNSDKKKLADDDEDGDDINDIAESRTFLAKVCAKSNTIHWLEMAEFDNTDMYAGHYLPPEPGVPPPVMNQPMQPLDANQAHYYPAYAATKHQHDLKSYQQQSYHQMMYGGQPPQYAQMPQGAWPGHYPGQPMAPGMPGQPPPPPPPPPHAHHAPATGPPPPAPVPPTPAPAPAEATASPSVPVTAGEAAAQRRKREREAAQSAAPVPAPAPLPAPLPSPAPAPAPTPTAGEQAAARRKQQQILFQQNQQQQPPPPPPPHQQQGQPQTQQQQQQHHYQPQHQHPPAPPQWQMYHPHMYVHHPPPPQQHGYAPHPGTVHQQHGGHVGQPTTEQQATASPSPAPGTHDQMAHVHYGQAPAHYPQSYQPHHPPPAHQPHQQQPPAQHHQQPQQHGSPAPHPVQHQAPQHTPPRQQHPATTAQHQGQPSHQSAPQQPPPPHHEHPEQSSDENAAKRPRL